MRELPRRIGFRLLITLSLLACVAMGALWWRALYIVDHLSWESWTQHPLTEIDRQYAVDHGYTADVTLHDNRFQFISWRGTLVFEYLHQSGGYGRNDVKGEGLDAIIARGGRFEWSHQVIDDRSTVWGDAWTHFGFRADTPSVDPLVRYWSVPLWLLMVLCCVPSLALLHRQVRRRARENGGLCSSCGYDIRATPARCPECWTIAPRGTLAE